MKTTNKMILLGTIVCYLLLLAGCGGTPAEKDVSVKGVSQTAAGQPKITKKESAIAVLEEITKASPDKPGVTRVVMTLDQKASYSTSREGDRLIINIFNARMKSSIKELEVRDDPVVASITATQIGNSVKSIVKLVEPDVAYTPSTSTDPFQIFVDVWKLSAQAGVKPQSRNTSEQATVPKPLRSIDIETSPSQPPDLSDSSRTKDVVVDTRPTPEEPSATSTPVEQVTSVSTTPPSSEDVPAQLQWFSEKLSQVLQEKERLKQDLLEAEKSFTVKDSMIEVLERKLKEANARIVELEEELIKVKSNMSLAEQRQSDAQDEMYQLLAQLEEVVSGKVTTVVGALSPDQIRERANQLVSKISTKISNLERQSASLNKTQQEVSDLQAKVASLTRERDELQEQLDASTAEMNALRQRASRLAEVEKELRTKELELSRLRRAIGAAAQLVVEEPQTSGPATVPRTTPKPTVIPESPTGTTKTLDTAPSSQPSTSSGAAAADSEGQSDAQRMLADLLQQQQMAGQSTSPDAYVLGPDDAVKITVDDEENLDKTVTVSPDGFINYPLLGDLRVDGLTVAQLDAQITSLLARDFLVDPAVSVQLVKQRSKKVYIMGLVKHPGYHELEGDQTLLSALLSAGGPSSFQTEARILRLPKGGDMMDDSSSMESFTPIVVDLNSLFVAGDQSQNIVLRDGDVVMVASTQKTSTAEGADASELGPDQFYVVGSVANPGIYTYKENDTVLDAILRAGGFTEFASRNNTKLVREASDGKTRTFRVKMKDIMEKGEMDKNMPIRAGDMIIVPESFF